MIDAFTNCSSLTGAIVIAESQPSSPRALLLIDFQHDFLSDDGRMPVATNQVGGVIAAAQAAIEQATSAGDLIVCICNQFRKGDFLMNALRHYAALAGSPGARWDPRIDAKDAIHVAKWKKDAFCNPALHQVLLDHEVERVSLAGLYARACISATARGALERGLEVQILTDAVACRTDATRHAALVQMVKRGAELVSGSGSDS